MPRLEVVEYSGVTHLYETVQRPEGLVSRCVGYVTAGRLFRRFAAGTFEDAETFTVHAGSDADAVECLAAVAR